jgi:hypothetical protein
MSSINNLTLDIQELLDRGFSYNTVAHILEIPVSWVTEVSTQYDDLEYEPDYGDLYEDAEI